jgi:hypothetical protein
MPTFLKATKQESYGGVRFVLQNATCLIRHVIGALTCTHVSLQVLLDKLAITRRKENLGQENTDLRSILKQYLDGISVNSDVMTEPNPLFVLNNRTNIQAAAVISEEPITVQNANVVVRQHEMMQRAW